MAVRGTELDRTIHESFGDDEGQNEKRKRGIAGKGDERQSTGIGLNEEETIWLVVTVSRS